MIWIHKKRLKYAPIDYKLMEELWLGDFKYTKSTNDS